MERGLTRILTEMWARAVPTWLYIGLTCFAIGVAIGHSLYVFFG